MVPICKHCSLTANNHGQPSIPPNYSAKMFSSNEERENYHNFVEISEIVENIKIIAISVC